jgi:CheY-like chemotaxis protein
MKALLIDDSHTMRAIGRAVLTELGSDEIREAGDGAEALAALDGFEPDLVVVDGRMPRMDGPTFIARYRAAGGRAAVVLTLTHADRAPIVPPGRRGADIVLRKPFTPDLLSQRIDEALHAAPSA